MGILSNSNDAIAELSRKRQLEIVSTDVSLDVPMKYKRRKVSAHRDFPKGCGRFAPRINEKQSADALSIGSIENSTHREEGAALVELDSVKQSGSLGESGTLELAKNSDLIESSNLMQAETTKSFVSLDQAEVLEPMKTVEPVAVENPKFLDQTELFNPSTTLEPETMDLSKNLNQTELLGSMKNSYRPESMNVLENASQPEEKDFLNNLALYSPIDIVPPDILVLSKVSNQPQTSIPVVEAVELESTSNKYPPRRRISASRDFPPGCGRNAPCVSKEECLKSIAFNKNRSLGTEKSSGENTSSEQMFRDDANQIREKVQDGDAVKCKLKGNINEDIGGKVWVKSEGVVKKEVAEHVQVRKASESKLKQEDAEENSIRSPRESNFSRLVLKSSLVSKKIDRDFGSSVGKLSKESVNLSKDKSFKRKFPGESENECCAINQSQREESIGFEISNDRVIVQALMAAPNCPWRQGKRAFKSPNVLTHGTGRNKVKKIAVDKSKSVFRKKQDEAEYSVEKSIKDKMPPTGTAGYQGMNQLVAIDEDESPGHGEEDENLPMVQRSQDLELSVIPFGLHTLVDKDNDCEAVVTRNKVRETLRLFQAICRKLLQEEEAKSKEHGNAGRIDLTSARILKDKHKWVNTGKPILGPVAGVEVGDEFHYRVELAIIGLHRPFQGGIDSLKKGGKILATSIVASGGYADDMDSSDVLVYSGQGGNMTSRDKQPEDQKLERGNLALKNSIDERTPVRVIRGIKEMKGSESLDVRGKMVTTYTYDGLYLVEKYWQEKGRYGNFVLMFQLRRILGQPELAWKEVKKSKKSTVREGLCVDDISEGKEKRPICAVNTIDNEKPPPFKYITNMIYPSWYNPTLPRGCDCTDGCSDSVKCICAVKNGGEIPFNYNGAIVEEKPLVYECGPSCRCPPSCHNRVSQHGLKFQLEIFKTESRGWGVRSLTSIPSGSFICEYTGELLQDKEAERRTGNDEYLFDIGNNYNDHALWDGLSTLIPPDLQSNNSCETVEDVGFTIDAAQYGSVGRFINHSCSPNLYAQNVLYDHDDKRMPHIMLFAAENIPPLQELTYHYNYMIDQVRDSNGNVKKKNCYCGSLECTGRLY